MHLEDLRLAPVREARMVGRRNNKRIYLKQHTICKGNKTRTKDTVHIVVRFCN